ncbi:MAG: hypothetical protein US58_C0004G0011 [Candidatus Magasanikbacteria bacterium GW2011_GWA2_37_8]|uniref:ABC-2 type transporter n=1 Tax=Candidatus Magasanikbacteria bacterium GW2011_GWA2_37_8 TaxID=1619036 RepID=A0A0G0JWE1_9BACT|nr:MAG: hypothetical protein US58_C0004G0011 [Candidatus Magasanikbacteria bacterium GW2011_GWA2_37_8]
MIKAFRQLTKTYIQQHLAYRMRMLIWFIADLSPFIIFPIIWLSIYKQNTSIAGFDRTAIITYYLITAFIVQTCTSHVGGIFQRNIVQGKLNIHLVRPLSFISFAFIHEFSYRLISFFPVTVLAIIIYIFFPDYFRLPSSPFTWILFALVCLIVLTMSHLLEMISGLTSFWFGENKALDNFIYFFYKVFSGAFAPLAFFPIVLQNIANCLPFKYLAYFPAQIFLEQIHGYELFYGLTLMIVWLLILALIVSFLWRRGLRQYDGSGI